MKNDQDERGAVDRAGIHRLKIPPGGVLGQDPYQAPQDLIEAALRAHRLKVGPDFERLIGSAARCSTWWWGKGPRTVRMLPSVSTLHYHDWEDGADWVWYAHSQQVYLPSLWEGLALVADLREPFNPLRESALIVPCKQVQENGARYSLVFGSETQATPAELVWTVDLKHIKTVDDVPRGGRIMTIAWDRHMKWRERLIRRL